MAEAALFMPSSDGRSGSHSATSPFACHTLQARSSSANSSPLN